MALSHRYIEQPDQPMRRTMTYNRAAPCKQRIQAKSPMRRSIVFALILAVVILGAGTVYWVGHRSITVERPSLGGPPPQQGIDLVGQAVPAFAAVDYENRQISTAALRGKVAVINVWATWCKPCVEELPRLEHEIWQRHGREVAVVAVAHEQSAAIIRRFNERANLSFALVPDPDGDISRLFGGTSIPRTYVVNRSGIVVYQSSGYGTKAFAELALAVDRAIKQD